VAAALGAAVLFSGKERFAMLSSEGYVTTEDGVRLFFRRLGDGPKALIIPNGFCLIEDFQRLAHGRMLIVYDLRNRGRSDSVSDASKLTRGIHNDVDDLEAVRRHFEIPRADMIGHSYVGVTVILYAMKHVSRVGRIVQIGPSPLRYGMQYPAHLTCADATLVEVLAKLAQMQKNRGSEEPEEFCRKFWSVLRVIYVADPADAGRIDWGRCDLPNERNLMKYWVEAIIPSLQSLDLTAAEMSKVTAPVLTVHGTRDRSAPYGGGREWVSRLPNARLVTVEEAGHAPWIEAPELVFGSIETFLSGAWPESARKVESIDPREGASWSRE
jgi:pimeloyl-ACP methyl ester carboxylesterase